MYSGKTIAICSGLYLLIELAVLTNVVLSSASCVCLKNFTTGLYNPVQMLFREDGVYIAEQRGIVRYFKTLDKNGTVLLDITNRVLKTNSPSSEQGLLGFTLHPNYKENGKLYVFYMGQSTSTKYSQLSEFTAHDNVALPSTERFLMRIEKASNAGNGGQILFGHDGYLYISVGDGVGDVGDQHDAAQNPSSLKGKILRIDVNSQSFANGSALSYGIPPTNPFFDKPPWRKEVFAYGCRDMWRCSQDIYPAKTGERRIFCGDPGARAYEEINIIRDGRNYGWDVMEGIKCYNSAQCARGSLENEELPIYVYKHTAQSHAVVGGYVYRGGDIPGLTGRYIFGDALTGNMSVLTEEGGTWTGAPLTVCAPQICPCDARESLRSFILSYAQDPKGEVYVLTTTTLGISVNDGVALKMTRNLERKITCGASQGTVSFYVLSIAIAALSIFI